MARELSVIREDSKENEALNTVSLKKSPNGVAKKSPNSVAFDRKKKVIDQKMAKRNTIRVDKVAADKQHQQKKDIRKRSYNYGKNHYDKTNWSQGAALRRDNHNDIHDLQKIAKEIKLCHETTLGSLYNKVLEMDYREQDRAQGIVQGGKSRKNKRNTRRKQNTRKTHKRRRTM
jgi:hypothetical protein